MTIDSQTIITEDEVKQDFSRATTIAEEFGQAVIFRDHRPKFILIDLEGSPVLDLTDDEKIDLVAARILKRLNPHLRNSPSKRMFYRFIGIIPNRLQVNSHCCLAVGVFPFLL